jgi:hypothetical protein
MFLRGSVSSIVLGSAVAALVSGCAAGGSVGTAPLQAVPGASVARSAQALSFAPPRFPAYLLPGSRRASAPDRSGGFAEPDAAKQSAIIISDQGTDDVYVDTVAGKRIATITGFTQPAGLAVDSAGDVYVVDESKDTVSVYKKDYKTLIATLSDPAQSPNGVAVAPKSGVVAVANLASGSVSLYAKGATTPCATAGNSAWGAVFFAAFDAAGNLYVTGANSARTATLVGTVQGGCSAKSIVTLTTANSVLFAGGVEVTTTGKIAIGDDGVGAIYTYDPPVNGSLGTPVSTTPLTGSHDIVQFALAANGKDVWGADYALADAFEYAYPKGGAAIATIGGLSKPVGLAVTPAANP